MFNFVRINAALVAGIDLTKAPHFKLTSERASEQKGFPLDVQFSYQNMYTFNRVMIAPLKLTSERASEYMAFGKTI